MAADGLLALFDLLLVVAVARCGGALAVRVGQPRIAGELVAVIAIGPTILGGQVEGVVDGAVAAGAVGALFPATAVDVLTGVGGLGLILYMLLVGMTIDPAPMLRRSRAIALLAVAIVASTVVIASVAGLWLDADGGWLGPAAGLTAFVLALIAALSAHGVPVVARILEDRGLLRTDVGAVVIATGACVTTTALVVSGVAVKGGDGAAALRLVLTLAVAGIVVAAVAGLARSRRVDLAPRIAVAVVLALAVVAGVAGKQLIGTALVGPLVVGVLVCGGGLEAAFIESRLGTIVRGALLPVFLGVAALHANLRELEPGVLLPVVAILAALTVTKLVTGYLAARAGGFDEPDARAVGALLQCGGIMTIAISLDVLQAGIISTRTHAALTLVGLVTTVITGPLLTRARTRRDALAPAACQA